MKARSRQGPVAQKNRIALYLGDGRTKPNAAELHSEFEVARAHGLRIVTVRHEAPRAVAAGHRPVLKRLLARMEAGEFEAIVTVVDGQAALSSLPPPTVNGDAWFVHPQGVR